MGLYPNESWPGPFIPWILDAQEGVTLACVPREAYWTRTTGAGTITAPQNTELAAGEQRKIKQFYPAKGLVDHASGVPCLNGASQLSSMGNSSQCELVRPQLVLSTREVNNLVLAVPHSGSESLRRRALTLHANQMPAAPRTTGGMHSFRVEQARQ
ncbi:hypothetical protein RRG08_030150 [Elysia crispata]|uniref:Uncharacterized protein n=1 Tax=Elysia crispata TaxID=231223 RepID=A0AAE0ZR55_9GAST|nr:hypothetical protein RRG08_030150 [Elysia crispata]